MENLFSFDYQVNNIPNEDGSESRFFSVYGEGGNVMHCKKDTYHLVQTQDLSRIGHAFIDKGLKVTPFTHRNGEVIGLNVHLGNKATKVGEKTYNAFITVPNNGSGRGYFSIKELRLICTNGMVQTLNNSKQSVKVPHNADYNEYLNLMQQAIDQFVEIVNYIEERDQNLNDAVVKRTEALLHLNRWFYNYEMPASHKEGMTFDKFRELLATNPESIKSYDRYEQLKEAFNAELNYNEELDLKLSMYTVFATVTNYLSRRVEKSKSKASDEVQITRASKKLEYFEAL